MEIFDKIAYSESRTINTGNYEKVESFFSFSTTVKMINRLESTTTINHSESELIPQQSNQEEFSKAAKKAQTRVKAVLDAREKEIRVKSFSFCDYPTLEKMGLKRMDFLQDEE
jgi:pyruvate kinase